MKRIQEILKEKVHEAAQELYQQSIDENLIQIQKTRKEFNGDFTLVVFPLLKLLKRKPEECGEQIGQYLVQHTDEITGYNVVKGFLNLVVTDQYWIRYLNHLSHHTTGYLANNANPAGGTVMVEYSSPNTNKPLHLGHIRNNLLGYAISAILEANGHPVIKTNLVNDRGIHICKTMLAWQKWGNGETPESSGKKGDHLVGEYYVKFEQANQQQIEELKQAGKTEQEAYDQTPLIIEARRMLKRWEAGEPDVVALWEKMNNWVYQGFDETYKRLGVDFDVIYYESQTYQKGRDIVLRGLNEGILEKHEDGSVWIDLTEEGYDKKLLLRKDGTSVYMTQDIGTAVQRYEDYQPGLMLYVVGNEQDYHFNILPLILKKLGYEWADIIKHLSYGMVDLPSGKMKSREGTVVDADDLIDEMIETADNMSRELGKLDGYSQEDKEHIIHTIGLGALKYFILKVDPKKNMTFDPRESVDFNGNTGPFIQYTYARIQSVLKKGENNNHTVPEEADLSLALEQEEKDIIKIIHAGPEALLEAVNEYNPAAIANHCFELVKQYNQFYQEHSILKTNNQPLTGFRLLLSHITGILTTKSMNLLGINVPPRM